MIAGANQGVVMRAWFVLALLGLHAVSAQDSANPSFPDYGYGSMGAAHNPPIAGEQTSVFVVVQNTGNVKAEGVLVSLSSNEWGASFGGWVEIGTDTVGIEAGGSATVYFSTVFSGAAQVSLRATVEDVAAGGNSNTDDDSAEFNLDILNSLENATYTVPIRNNENKPIKVQVSAFCPDLGVKEKGDDTGISFSTASDNFCPRIIDVSVPGADKEGTVTIEAYSEVLATVSAVLEDSDGADADFVPDRYCCIDAGSIDTATATISVMWMTDVAVPVAGPGGSAMAKPSEGTIPSELGTLVGITRLDLRAWTPDEAVAAAGPRGPAALERRSDSGRRMNKSELTEKLASSAGVSKAESKPYSVGLPKYDIVVEAKNVETMESRHVKLRLVKSSLAEMLNWAHLCCVADVRDRVYLESMLARALVLVEEGGLQSLRAALHILRFFTAEAAAVGGCDESEPTKDCMDRASRVVGDAGRLIAEELARLVAEVRTAEDATDMDGGEEEEEEEEEEEAAVRRASRRSERAIAKLDQLDESSYKDSTLIMQSVMPTGDALRQQGLRTGSLLAYGRPFGVQGLGAPGDEEGGGAEFMSKERRSRFRSRDRKYKAKSGTVTMNVYSSNGGDD